MSDQHWEGKHYSYYSNRECEYFPCHPEADPEDFNCLFCYCPLYPLGRDCGGNFRYIKGEIKDCTPCLLPHRRKAYGYVIGKYQEVVRRMKALEEASGKMEGQIKTQEEEGPFAGI